MSSAVAIRRYRDTDLTAVAQIWFEGWEPAPGQAGERPPALLAELTARIPRELATRWDIYVATRDDKVVGMLAFTRAERYLDELYVGEGERGRGVGKRLLDFAKEELTDGFWLRTGIQNERARRFYRREGLSHSGDKPHPRFPERMTAIYAWKIASV